MLDRLGFCPLRLPVGMMRSGWICSTVSPPVRRRRTVCSMSVGDDWWPAAVLALAGGSVKPLQSRLADVLPLGLRHGCEEGEQEAAVPGGVVDPGQGPGEHLQDQAVRGEVVGE